MNVAIIDDGINEDLYDVGYIKHNVEITPDLMLKERSAYDPLKPSHGTICAAIIKKYAPGADLCSIKILNDNSKKGRCEQLLRGIEWCAENNIRLANVSLGSIEYRDFRKIQDCVNKASQKGLIIVAACNNRNVITYPACLSNVIGVKHDWSGILRKSNFHYNHHPFDGVEITACGTQFLITKIGEKMWKSGSNSFAAPVVTGIAHNMLEKDPSITVTGLKHELWNASANKTGDGAYHSSYCPRIDWVENALVFRVYQPGRSIKMPDYGFNIRNVIDINSNSFSFAFDFIINFLENEKQKLEIFDTIVIILGIERQTPGVWTELEMMSEMKVFYGKHVVFISDDIKESLGDVPDRYGNYKLWHPAVYRHFLKKTGEEMNIMVPVVGVYDFTGEENVFVLKMISDFFRNEGYFCIAACDDCSGAAAGLEYFPTEYFRDMSGISLLCRSYKPDLILYGINAARDDSVLDMHFKNESTDIYLFITDTHTDNLASVINRNTAMAAPVIILNKSPVQLPVGDRTVWLHFEDKNSLTMLCQHMMRIFGCNMEQGKDGIPDAFSVQLPE